MFCVRFFFFFQRSGLYIVAMCWPISLSLSILHSRRVNILYIFIYLQYECRYAYDIISESFQIGMCTGTETNVFKAAVLNHK